MMKAVTPRAELYRGYVQCKVIESNLEHLRMILSDADLDLRDDLQSFARTFGLYVRRLGDACTSAVAAERATDSRHGLRRAAVSP
jgi:hypothetical protein